MVEKALLYVQNYKYWYTQIPYRFIPKWEIGHHIRNRNTSFFQWRTESFKDSFFPYTTEAWYSLDPSIINSNSLDVFKSKLMAFIQPVQRSIYSVFNPQSPKFFTRLRLGLGHLNKHRFRYNFKDCINPLCSCTELLQLFAWVLRVK